MKSSQCLDEIFGVTPQMKLNPPLLSRRSRISSQSDFIHRRWIYSAIGGFSWKKHLLSQVLFSGSPGFARIPQEYLFGTEPSRRRINQGVALYIIKAERFAYHQHEVLYIIKPTVFNTHLRCDEIQRRRAAFDNIHANAWWYTKPVGLDKKTLVPKNESFLVPKTGVEPVRVLLPTGF